MNINEQIIIQSLIKNINFAKYNGKLDNRIIYLYDILQEYDVFTLNNSFYIDENRYIKELLNNIKINYNKDICNIKSVLPSYTNLDEVVVPILPILNNFTVDNITKTSLGNFLYDTYSFNQADLLNNYTGDTIYQIIIDRQDLDEGLLYYSPTLFDQSNIPYTVLFSNFNNLKYFTVSENLYEHDIKIKVQDINGNISNEATITIVREAVVNQPPTIGDNTIYPNNRVTTVLTLEMFTSELQPPYNDPEGDLIDAIRIDEISTANQGIFYFNGAEITTGQIITREDLIAELFTHEGADVNTISTDSINFSARDEGSQKWIQ